MAKSPKHAVLLEQFIVCVRDGLISARNRSSGPHTLECMRAAIQAILDGEEPDIALGIARNPGRQKNREQWNFIHGMKRQGIKWKEIGPRVNEWRTDRGLAEQRVSTLQRFYRQNKPSYLKRS